MPVSIIRGLRLDRSPKYACRTKMLRRSVISIVTNFSPPIRRNSTAPQTIATKWDLFVSVQLERLPVISMAFTELEKEYQDHLYRLEHEGSHKSEFEVRQENEIRTAELIKSGHKTMDLDEMSKATALDSMDQWTSELEKFKLASRTTEADANNDRRSTDRKLAHSLTLLLEQELGEQKLLLLPQGKVWDGEVLSDAARRIIREQCGDQLQFELCGNAPCGYHKYKYSPQRQAVLHAIGGKMFFYRAIMRSGKVDDKLKRNYQWLERTELFDRIKTLPGYSRSLNGFII